MCIVLRKTKDLIIMIILVEVIYVMLDSRFMFSDSDILILLLII